MLANFRLINYDSTSPASSYNLNLELINSIYIIIEYLFVSIDLTTLVKADFIYTAFRFIIKYIILLPHKSIQV